MVIFCSVFGGQLVLRLPSGVVWWSQFWMVILQLTCVWKWKVVPVLVPHFLSSLSLLSILSTWLELEVELSVKLGYQIIFYIYIIYHKHSLNQFSGCRFMTFSQRYFILDYFFLLSLPNSNDCFDVVSGVWFNGKIEM